MNLLKRNSSKKESNLVINEELPKNSIVINSTLKSSKFVVSSLKRIILPVSKSIDYLLFGLTSIILYNFYLQYNK